MAVAYVSITDAGTAEPDYTEYYSLSYGTTNTSGNAIVVQGDCDANYGGSINPVISSITYGGQSGDSQAVATNLTINFQYVFDYAYNYGWDFLTFGASALGISTGSNTVVITLSSYAWAIYSRSLFFSGAASSGTILAQSSNTGWVSDDANHTFTVSNTPSRTGDLVFIWINRGGDAGFVSFTGTPAVTYLYTEPYWFNFTWTQAGATPTVSESQTVYLDTAQNWGGGAVLIDTWSIPPYVAPTTPTGGVTVVSGVSDTGDVSFNLGISIKHTGTTLVDFT